MRIENVTSLSLSRRLQNTQKLIARALERLSTGNRLTRPGDDIAAYSLGVRLDSQTRGLRQSILNLNSARGLLNTASVGIQNLEDIVQQMRTLATQGANSSLTVNDRNQINTSLSNLLQEFQRVVNSTQFNDISLLNGGASHLNLILGAHNSDQLQLSLANLQSSQSFESLFATGEFESFTVEPTSYEADELLLEDVNNDGRLDRVLLSAGTSEVVINLGNGDGTFGEALTFAVTGTPTDLKLGDLDGDGNLDAVVASGNLSSIYLGNGTGTFSFDSTFGNFGGAMIGNGLADIDNDGDLDVIAYASAKSAQIFIRLNDGNANFSAGSNFSAAANVRDLVTGDFNNDGNLDIVYGTESTKSGSTLGIRFGNGDGTFGAETLYNLYSAGYGSPTLSNDIEVGDIDGDGDLDLIAASDAELVSLINDGSGTLSAPNQILNLLLSGGTINDVELVDFNDDGALDIAATQGDFLRTYLGNGSGSFDASVTTPTYQSFGMSELGDLNGDGFIDLVAGSASGDGLQTFLGASEWRTDLSQINVSSTLQAERLIQSLDRTLELLASQKAEVSALTQRVDSRENLYLLLEETNLEARSRILDADFALETANLVSAQIQQQAQVAALAQANINLQLVLDLLN